MTWKPTMVVFRSLLQLWIIICFALSDRHQTKRSHRNVVTNTKLIFPSMDGCYHRYISAFHLCSRETGPQVIYKKSFILLSVAMQHLNASDKATCLLKIINVSVNVIFNRAGRARKKGAHHQWRFCQDERLRLNKLYFCVKEARGSLA